ncbi:hypothetical protein GGS21DRAFT_492479 [Xylaria nigripes]|nr:hypothetical protein GGS21DRAFT_492479 [Xylaria nigripes]
MFEGLRVQLVNANQRVPKARVRLHTVHAKIVQAESPPLQKQQDRQRNRRCVKMQTPHRSAAAAAVVVVVVAVVVTFVAQPPEATHISSCPHALRMSMSTARSFFGTPVLCAQNNQCRTPSCSSPSALSAV